MATRKYLSLERLTEYDELIKGEISDGDASTLSSAKSYTNTEVAKKADKVHSHDDLYYTETEIDSKLSAINTSIGNITSGTTVVKEAQHATSADSATNANHAETADSATNANHATSADSATNATNATNATTASNAEKLGGQLPSYYAKASDIPTGALADKDIVSEYDLDSDLAEKVNAAAEGNHSHSNKTVLDGITSAKVTAWDAAEGNAKTYADSVGAKVKSDLLNGAGTAYDTLKELGDLIDNNQDAIKALETIASGKADATHGHAISDVSGLQSALDGKADSSHGTHVSFDSTNKPKMDGTAAFGTSTKVARADHVHPTDTSRAAKTDFDTHVADTTKHITATERTNWGTAYTHSQASHAPVEAEANKIDVIKVNGTAQTITNKSVNITVPTDNKDLANGAGYITSSAITNKADKATTLSGYGITNAYTKTEVDAKTVVDTDLSATSTNPVQNKAVNSAIVSVTGLISKNTESISAHTNRISALETKVGDGFEEITSDDIRALFA